MSGSAKIGGAWKSVNSVKVKVGGSWKTVSSASVKVGGAWKTWFTALITDLFNRTTSGSLGTTDTGQTWSNTRGVWYANGSAAQSDTDPATYPLASIPFNQDATVSVTPSPGTGVAFWVTDSGSWWASVAHETYTSYTYDCNPYSCTLYSGSYTCGSLGTFYYGGTSFTSCGDAQSFMCNACASNYGYTCSDFVCNTSSSTCYNTCTGYSTNYFLRILKSISNTISNAISDISLPSFPAKVKVTTTGDSITAKAYSDAAMTTQIGATMSHTPTSPVKGLGVGILKSPSSYAQGSTADSFSASI